MILLDTDTLTLLHAGHRKVTERVTSASEVPKITLVTQIESLRSMKPLPRSSIAFDRPRA
jgi:hypothetical protein